MIKPQGKQLMFVLRRARRRHVSAFTRSKSTFLPAELPPLHQWKNEFPWQGNISRVYLKNEETADRLTKSFFWGSKSDDGKIVIEAFPGPGVLTRSLLKLSDKKIKKLIVLEDGEVYLPYLKTLEQYDPRVKVIPLSGFDWSTYTTLEADGILDDVVKTDWEEGVPNLHFVAHIPHSVLGEQLTNQFIRHIPERAWLFKYGRMPMSLLLSDYSYRRMTATPHDREYCKLSIVAQASAQMKLALPKEDLQPYKEHFHPQGTGSEVVERKGKQRPPGSPFVGLHVNPLKDPIIKSGMLDKWDYILRRVFVLKSTPIRRAIVALGPGANNLLPLLGDPNLPKEERIDLNKKVRELKMRELQLIVKVFNDWPFRPDDLNISEAIYKDVERDR